MLLAWTPYPLTRRKAFLRLRAVSDKQALKGVDEFNALQHISTRSFNTIQRLSTAI
jgi:hypothetical protein